MEYVDLTMPASIFTPHAVVAMCSNLTAACGLGSAGSELPLWGRVSHVSPSQPYLAVVSPFAVGAPPCVNAILLHAQ